MAVDLAILAIALGLGILGFFRGIFSQAWGLLALAGAFFGAEPVLERLSVPALFGPEAEGPFGIFMMRMLAGLTIYIGLLILGRLIEYLIIERLSLLQAGNRVLGGALGLVKGVIIAVLALWIGQFGASYLAGEVPGLTRQLSESVAMEALGGYNPLNFLYLNRLAPFLKGDDGQGKPLPKGFDAPPLEQLVSDGPFALALKAGDMQAIVTNPAYQAAMSDPRVALLLSQLGPAGQRRAPAAGGSKAP